MPFAQPQNALVDKRGNAVSLLNPLKLHIGGHEKRSGWRIFDSLDSEVVDFVGHCSDLSRFPKDSCSDLYCSHVIEHLSHVGETGATLQGFHRILKPNGLLMIAVPDLKVLSRLFIREDLDIGQRNLVMRMMFGGQVDEYDFHKTGFDFDMLQGALITAGFSNITRVESFGLFTDSSEIALLDQYISLNVTARA